MTKLLRVAIAENPLGASPRVINAIRRNLNRLHIYPRYDELRSAISEKYNVESKNVVLGNGVEELISMIARVVGRNEVIIITPSFYRFKYEVHLVGGNVVSVPLNNNYEIEFNDVKTVLSDEVKAIFVCNPNNVLGVPFNLDTISKMAGSLKNGVVVVDEAYIELEGNSAIDLFKEYDNIAILRTFSKAYGLAGLRIGYCIGSQSLVGSLIALKPIYNVNSLAVVAALEALTDEEHLNRSLKRIREIKKEIATDLMQLGLSIKLSYANFLILESDEFSAQNLSMYLKRKWRLVRVNDITNWRYFYQEELDG